MVGANDFVVVVVVNDVPARSPSTNDNTRIAALNTIERDTRGNPHRRSAIQKQAYPSSACKVVRQAYGLTGTDYRTHLAYANGKLLGLDDTVSNYTEIVLVATSLVPKHEIIKAAVHRVLPWRTRS